MEKTHVIRHWRSGKILFSLKCESFQLCVYAAISWGINLSYASFKNALFYNISFDNVEFDNVRFYNIIFENVSLENTIFNKVIFDNVSFYNVNLDSARFENVSLNNIKGLIGISQRSYRFLIQNEWSKIVREFRKNDEWLDC